MEDPHLFDQSRLPTLTSSQKEEAVSGPVHLLVLLDLPVNGLVCLTLLLCLLGIILGASIEPATPHGLQCKDWEH